MKEKKKELWIINSHYINTISIFLYLTTIFIAIVVATFSIIVIIAIIILTTTILVITITIFEFYFTNDYMFKTINDEISVFRNKNKIV